MSMFAPASPPPSKLGVYRLLSPNAGVHVSPLVFGAMSIGDSERWNQALGQMDSKKSFDLLDAYYDNGGNFIDTANNYQDETSEMLIGEWAENRGIRDQLFIATKFTTDFKHGNESVGQQVMYVGNNTKSLRLSVHASLKKLRTDYIDLLYVHWWDYDTSVAEVMISLHALVQSGKVLYLGISDTPAWVVSKANQYAKDHALTPFSVYQGAWNVMSRDFEREIIPMARSEGLALVPWNVLASGKFHTEQEEEQRRTTGEHGRKLWSDVWEQTAVEKKVSAALAKVAEQVGTKSITAVAIAYVMHKAPFVFPLVGGRKVEHLKANIQALEIHLTNEQMQELEGVVPFDPGFPSSFVGDGTTYSKLMKAAGNFEPPLLVRPHSHKK